jgi:hypothetical protein
MSPICFYIFLFWTWLTKKKKRKYICKHFISLFQFLNQTKHFFFHFKFKKWTRLAENDYDDNSAAYIRYKPRPIEELVKITRFTKKEIQLMYRGFKQVSYMQIFYFSQV